MFKDVLTLVSGTAISQIILLLALPILARVYVPSDFGQLAMILALLLVISPFGTLRYETAILLDGKPHCSFSLVILSVILSIISTIVLFFILPTLLKVAAIDFIIESLYILPFLFLLMSINEIFTSWHIKKKRFKKVTIGKIIQAFFTVSMQIYLAIMHDFDYKGLLFGYTVGLCVSALYYIQVFIKEDHKYTNYKESFSQIKVVAVLHKKFPLYSTWATVLSSLSNHLPIILFGKYFSIAVTGNYEMARKLIRGPMSMIGQSMFRVTSQRIGKMLDKEKEASKKLLSVMMSSANYIVIPISILAFFLEDGIVFILGEQWAVAGVYAQIILPWMFVLFLSWPLTSAFNTFGYQLYLIVFNLIFISCYAIALIMHIQWSLSDIETLIIISTLSVLVRIWYCYWILNKCGSGRLRYNFTIILIYVSIISMASYVGIQKV
jgi:lipopolysaccharide exporter